MARRPDRNHSTRRYLSGRPLPEGGYRTVRQVGIRWQCCGRDVISTWLALEEDAEVQLDLSGTHAQMVAGAAGSDKANAVCPSCGSDTVMGSARLTRILQGLRTAFLAGKSRHVVTLDIANYSTR